MPGLELEVVAAVVAVLLLLAAVGSVAEAVPAAAQLQIC